MRILLFTLPALMLAACATPYDQATSVLALNDTGRFFQIDSAGNSDTSKKRVDDYALLRATDLCKEKGFKYFSIAGDAGRASTASIPLLLSNGTGGFTASSMAYTTHAKTLRVLYYKDGEKIPPDAYQCGIIGNQLKSYKVEAAAAPTPAPRSRNQTRIRDRKF